MSDIKSNNPHLTGGEQRSVGLGFLSGGFCGVTRQLLITSLRMLIEDLPLPRKLDQRCSI